MQMERHFPITLLFLLHSGGECVIREEKVKDCRLIKTRALCLLSKNKISQDCVWCTDGACATKPKRVMPCLAKEYAKKLELSDTEDCLLECTQKGYSGSHYS